MKGVTFVGLGGYGLPHTRVRCYHFAQALQERGFRTRVYSFKDRLRSEDQEAAMYALSDRQKFSLVARAVPSLARRPRDLLVVQKAHYHAAAVLALHRLLGRPFVLDYDDYEIGADPSGVPLHCGFRRGWLQRLNLGAENALGITLGLAQEAEGCVVASGMLQDFLRNHTKRVVYVPTGVNVRDFTPGERRTAEPVFVWTGLVWGETILRGVELVLEAFREVRRRVDAARLMIVGGGAWMPRVRDMAGDVAGVSFAGQVEPEEMPGILRHANVGIFPPLPDCPWSVGKSPTKLFEYMASGLAVVSWKEGESGQVIDDRVSGLLVGDGRELSEAMIALAEDVSLRRRIGSAARDKVVQQYSLDVLSERLARFLEDVGVERS